MGPIPARAGEPLGYAFVAPAIGAYPRSRGGTFMAVNRAFTHSGLSPLARGNRAQPLPWLCNIGPIPARAGEPLRRHWPHRRPWAYPRSRGGTWNKMKPQSRAEGLSPLARGNRRCD